MATGPGIYDWAATQARRDTLAEGVILIVLNGEHGNGFSVQAPREVTEVLPDLLRDIAGKIERTCLLKKKQRPGHLARRECLQLTL